MFIHIGEGRMVDTKEIVAILDMRSAREAPDTREFLWALESEGRTEILGEGNRSVVLVRRRDGQFGYYSPIQTVTLQGRCDQAYFEGKDDSIHGN
ncbi:extracellular matrix regulator RemB [Gehongia tenuis]|uniref:DUF370 domain-containing protein n=1 Tax=Gehongia tenuis TaxID=2763655 RepID=A0A926HR89_9FIRM|nr:extracellular matrix/biofilm biosynthesis regulator RemA family protein [Gehongia tenuis]MBC8532056.1 DUF370 domain-containing protein [Gehongia tenuis]